MGAPVITSVTLAPVPAVANQPISVDVDWTGDPDSGEIRYQWRQSGRDLFGATERNYTPFGEPSSLYCEVSVDNGRGFAISASAYADFTPIPDPEEPPIDPPVDPEEPPVDPEEPPVTPSTSAFSIEFSEDFA